MIKVRSSDNRSAIGDQHVVKFRWFSFQRILVTRRIGTQDSSFVATQSRSLTHSEVPGDNSSNLISGRKGNSPPLALSTSSNHELCLLLRRLSSLPGSAHDQLARAGASLGMHVVCPGDLVQKLAPLLETREGGRLSEEKHRCSHFVVARDRHGASAGGCAIEGKSARHLPRERDSQSRHTTSPGVVWQTASQFRGKPRTGRFTCEVSVARPRVHVAPYR